MNSSDPSTYYGPDEARDATDPQSGGSVTYDSVMSAVEDSSLEYAVESAISWGTPSFRPSMPAGRASRQP